MARKGRIFCCDTCGTKFENKKGRQRYCSIECKKAFERKKKKNSYILTTLRKSIFKRDNYTCIYCKKTKDDNITLHCDHLIPLSKGGKPTIHNLVTSCEDCNRMKHDKLLEGKKINIIQEIIRRRNIKSNILDKRSNIRNEILILLEKINERQDEIRKFQNEIYSIIDKLR